jgi:hypothetical protein
MIAAAAVLPIETARGHTPYRQWVVYRRKHLLIGASRADPSSYVLAKKLVAIFHHELPDAKARVTRARNQERLASLITTGQIATILLRPREARALRDGSAPFADYGPFPLVGLAAAEGHCLVAASDFPAHHAWLVARALSGLLERANQAFEVEAGLPLHTGVAAFLAGEPMPDAPEVDEAEDIDHDHGHSHGPHRP